MSSDVSTSREAFVEAFRTGWALGAGADGFIEHFVPAWVDPEVTLAQPLSPDEHGYGGFEAFARRTFALMPDLRCEVRSYRPTDDGLTLDLRFSGTVGGRPVAFDGTDTVVLRDGRLLRRDAEFDLGPVVRAGLRSPRFAARLASVSLDGRRVVDGALVVMAVGRLVLGAAARLAPGPTTTAFGAGDRRTPELDYLNRVFGIRAIALGVGYLRSPDPARRLWQRLAFLCDASDTVAGVGDIVRGDVARRTAIRATALTGAYAAIGAIRLRQDRRADQHIRTDRPVHRSLVNHAA